MTNCLGNNHRHTWQILIELLISILPLYEDSFGDEVFKVFIFSTYIIQKRGG